MKQFFQLLKRYLPPYKWYMVLSIISNILSAILNLLAFSLIMPILRILFRIDKRVVEYMPLSGYSFSVEGIKGWINALVNDFSWYVSTLIDERGASFTLIMLGLYLVIMTLLKVSATYLALYSMIPIRTGVVRDIRNQLNRKILSLPLSFFSEERKGDILARMSGDVNEVENSVMNSLDILIKDPILITIYLIAMIAISWQLTVFVFILLPIAGFIMGRVGKTLKRSSLNAQNQWGDLMSQVEETLGGLRVIKAFNAEGRYAVGLKKPMRSTENRSSTLQPVMYLPTR